MGRPRTKFTAGSVVGWLTVTSRPSVSRLGFSHHYCKCVCGKGLWVRSDALKFGQRSCGCKNIRSTKRLVGKRYGRLLVLCEHPIRYGTHIRWLCICACGRYTTVVGSELLKGQQSCGCLSRELSAARHGKSHPSFNHSLTDLDREQRRSRLMDRRWSALRARALRRDNKTCRACGATRVRFQVHHVCGWTSNPKSRFLLRNCVSLCYPCHVSFHRQFGRGNNNWAQFREFCKQQREKNNGESTKSQRGQVPTVGTCEEAVG